MWDPDSEIVRPRLGMTLFKPIEGTEWKANAQINSHPEWFDYKSAYELATQLLVDRAADGEMPDLLIYPIMFIARQTIELGLKEIIVIAGQFVEAAEAYPNSHSLTRLWSLAKSLLERADAPLQDEATQVFESLLHQIHEVDPGSMTFRYPEGNKGEPSYQVALDGATKAPKSIPPEIDTAELKIVLDAMFNYLSATRDWLENVAETSMMARDDLSAGDMW